MTRVKLKSVYEEVERAELELSDMLKVKDLAAKEEHWKEFLVHINRSFNRLESLEDESPEIAQKIADTREIRKTDPLLEYVKETRNTHEHTLSPIIEKIPGMMSISPAYGNTLILEHFSLEQGVVSIGNSNVPLKIDVNNPELKLLAVKGRSKKNVRIIQPPEQHLGKDISDKSPVGVAKLAIAYYRSLVAEVEKVLLN